MTKVLGVLALALAAWGSAAQAVEQGRWQQVENNPSCSVWNAYTHRTPLDCLADEPRVAVAASGPPWRVSNASEMRIGYRAGL